MHAVAAVLSGVKYSPRCEGKLTHCTAMSLNFGEFVAVGSMSAAVNMVPMCNASHIYDSTTQCGRWFSSTNVASKSYDILWLQVIEVVLDTLE